jgi:plastocyanin
MSTSTSTRPSRRPAVLLAALALALAACGGDDASGAAEGGGDAVSVVGTDDLRFEPATLSVDAGTVEFELVCEDQVNHNLVIEETGEEVVSCTPGETATGTVDLDAGDYTYICTVPGHETTMRGDLTVG